MIESIWKRMRNRGCMGLICLGGSLIPWYLGTGSLRASFRNRSSRFRWHCFKTPHIHGARNKYTRAARSPGHLNQKNCAAPYVYIIFFPKYLATVTLVIKTKRVEVVCNSGTRDNFLNGLNMQPRLP